MFACVVAFSAGAQSLSFINTPSDARSAAMGESGYAMKANAFATRYNTAGILFSGDRAAAGLSFLNWQPDGLGMLVWNAGGYYALNERIGLAAGVRINSQDAYTRFDEDGNNLGDFTPREQAIDLGVAYRIADRFGLAATFRYIGSDIGAAEKGSSFALDLDAYYSSARLRLGLGVSNLGSKAGYGYSKVALPSRLKLGAGYDLFVRKGHTLAGNAEFNYQFGPKDYAGATLGLGAEYTYKGIFSLRGGYHLSNGEKTGDGYGSLGAGVNIWKLSLDGAYLLAGADSYIKNTLLVSLGCRF